MIADKLTENVWYIGVNDRTTHLFESLWPLPYGVSYNSYLVVGPEKTAIIDGVEGAHALEQIRHIKAVLGDRQPDYLIINHIEPDHSGSVKFLRDAFPGITVVGNAQTLNMAKGFYGIDEGTLAIKDGDTLSLGDACTLRFATIPMVHWPETMVTYLEEEKVLFSGDAFGCYGALNGAVKDVDMDTSLYFREMVRYYSNIVGPYGVPVQRALAKLSSLEPAVICPTHGPMWTEKIGEVVHIYDTLSRYEPLEKGVTIVYGSMYGHTEAMAEMAARTLAECGVRNIAVHNAAVSPLSDILADVFRYGGLVLAAPTYNDGLFPPMAALVEALAARHIKHRETVVVGGFTWASRSARLIAEKLPWTLDRDPVEFKQAPDGDVVERCREQIRGIAEKI